MFQITVIDIKEATAKTTTKTWLAKVAVIFIHRTRLTYNLTINEDCLLVLDSILI